MDDIFPANIADFDDGHKPGNSATPTRIATYSNKSSANFFSTFDGLLDDRWCIQAYEYAIQKSKPWGIESFNASRSCVIYTRFYRSLCYNGRRLG